MTATLDGSVNTAGPQNVYVRGRNAVAPRALDRLVSAVAADAFGVAARSVHVDLSDHNGLLALHVRTPIRTVALERVRQSSVAVERSGGTLIQRAADAHTTIRDRVTELAGADIAHVTIRLTGIDTQRERRVT